MLESRAEGERNSMQTLSVKTDRRPELGDVTAQVQEAVSASNVADGICYFYVPHTTAAIAINECADPDAARDVDGALDRLIPMAGPYCHSEGNSDSHVKSLLVGASQTVFVHGGNLALRRWQGIFFCALDGPRDIKLHLQGIEDQK